MAISAAHELGLGTPRPLIWVPRPGSSPPWQGCGGRHPLVSLPNCLRPRPWPPQRWPMRISCNPPDVDVTRDDGREGVSQADDILWRESANSSLEHHPASSPARRRCGYHFTLTEAASNCAV